MGYNAITINELNLSTSKVEIVNTGSTTVDISNYRWCNLATGSPGAYPGSFTSFGSVDPTGSSAGLSLSSFAPGDVVTFTLTSGFLPSASGEIGIYLSSGSFSDSAAIVDYIAWGANGTRDSVAESAGLWTDDTFIDVTGLGSNSISLDLGDAGGSVADYSFAAASFGTAQSIPEPTGVSLLGLSLVSLLARRKRA